MGCDDNNIDTKSWGRERAFDRFKTISQGRGGTIHTTISERAKNIIDSLSKGLIPEFFPAQIQVNLTSICHRKKHYPGDCANCSFPTNNDNSIDPKVLLTALSNFATHGGLSLFLSGGGEPGSYENLEVLLSFLADDPLGQQLELTLNTNGAYIHRLLYLTKLDGLKGIEWRQRLKRIYSPQRGGREVLSIVSISWHDDDQGASGVKLLASLREELGLHLVIRVSSLVYGEQQDYPNTNSPHEKVGGESFSISTNVSQAKNIRSLAIESGADIICFKPAHKNYVGIRQHTINQSVYNYIISEFEYQKSIARTYNWEWNSCKDLPDFEIIFELSERVNRLKNNYKQVIPILINHDVFCIAPVAMLFLTSEGLAACCDTWDFGLGSHPLILLKEMSSPRLYYQRILYSMSNKFSEYWPNNCVIGCGWTELNLNNPLSMLFKSSKSNPKSANSLNKLLIHQPQEIT